MDNEPQVDEEQLDDLLEFFENAIKNGDSLAVLAAGPSGVSAFHYLGWYKDPYEEYSMKNLIKTFNSLVVYDG